MGDVVGEHCVELVPALVAGEVGVVGPPCGVGESEEAGGEVEVGVEVFAGEAGGGAVGVAVADATVEDEFVDGGVQAEVVEDHGEVCVDAVVFLGLGDVGDVGDEVGGGEGCGLLVVVGCDGGAGGGEDEDDDGEWEESV